MLWIAPKTKQRPSQGPDTPRQQDSKGNIQQAAASRLLAYKPAAWGHWHTDRSEQHTAATIRNTQGDLKQASPGPRSLPQQGGMLVQPQHCSARDTPNIPYAAEKRGKPVARRERNTLPAAEGRARPGLLLHCGGVSREAKPRKAQSCLVTWPVRDVEMGLHDK